MGYISSKPMKYLAKSPFLRSAMVASGIIGIYTLESMKLKYYDFMPPHRRIKPQYRKGSKIPRYEMDSAQRPEPYEEALRPVRTLKPVLPGQFKTLKLFSHAKLTLEDIYAEFQFNKEDLFCRSQNTIDRLLNGPFPIELSPDPKNPKILQRRVCFSEYSRAERCKVPDVTVRFRKNSKGLAFEEIIIEDRRLGKHVYRPDSPQEQWDMAQEILLGTWGYYGEMYNHILLGHIELEQYAIALNRNLSEKNPLFKVLIPHLTGLGAVNSVADKTLIGKNGVFTGVGLLSSLDAEKFMFHEMQNIDWKNWVPVKSLGPNHYYAHICQLYWKAVTEFVDEYFHGCREEMLLYLSEVQAFSDDLVQHAVPKNSHKRAKAVSAVMGKNPEETLNNIKELSRYLVFKTTLAHTWVHTARPDTPVAYRQQFFVEPSQYHAFQQGQEALSSLVVQLALEYSSINATRSYVGGVYPSLLKGYNPRGVSDILKSKLEKYRGQFREMGFNIDFVMSGIH